MFYKIVFENFRNWKTSYFSWDIDGELKPDYRNIPTEYYTSIKVDFDGKKSDIEQYIPLDPFTSKITLIYNSFYKGVFSGIVTHPLYGPQIISISTDKIIENNILLDGIQNYTTLKEYKIKIIKTGKIFTINFL